MCGIAGILYADRGRRPEPMVLRAMGEALAHRGPDAEGVWQEAGVGLVHRRLSIIDLESGDQPIGNEDGSIQVVFNGEIYNYQRLRRELESHGHVFRTRSDTEVLVHLYEEVGTGLVHWLRGMFAFALWDRNQRRLLLARDRVGIKPLYVWRNDEVLLFASEAKAILTYPGFARRIDATALEDYLAFGMVTGGRSIFQGIEPVPAGHTLAADAEHWQARPQRYWQLRFEPGPEQRAEEWQEQVRAKLAETVRLHLIADVPVGAFLSGGLDSSAVVAAGSGGWIAERGAQSAPRSALRAPRSALHSPLSTFSIGFHEEDFSELPYARQVAERFGTRHIEEIVTPDAVELVDELTHYFDEPFADASAIPTYLVSRLARQHVKVVLSGDGGDEAFGGYSRYAHDLQESRWRGRLPRWLRRWTLGPLGRMWPKADWLPRRLRAKTRLTNLSLEADAAYANTLTMCRQPLRRRLLAPDVAQNLNGHEPERFVRTGFAQGVAEDPLASMIAADVAVVLPDDFLVKVDRASMAHGLEVRPPLLDHEFLELAARIPSRFKVRDGQTKWIFKQACRSLLPADIIDRPKHGFDMPIDAWLRGPLRERFHDTVLDRQACISGLIDQNMARKVYLAHAAGRSRQGQVLWSLLILASWAERYLAAATCNGGLHS